MNVHWISLNCQSNHCTEVRFASFFSGGFTTMSLMNPPEKKLEKRTPVHCPKNSIKWLQQVFISIKILFFWESSDWTSFYGLLTNTISYHKSKTNLDRSKHFEHIHMVQDVKFSKVVLGPVRNVLDRSKIANRFPSLGNFVQKKLDFRKN